jgi:hypothetical protein
MTETNPAPPPAPSADKAGVLKAWTRLDINERLTAVLAAGALLTGVGSLTVSFLAWRTAADTTDIKAAISNLSTLATETKRQANGIHDQLGAMKDQVGAMRDQVGALKEQVGEAKLQTKAISEQTTAIKATSDANVRSAQAQQRMADITATAQTPAVALRELKVEGLDAEPDKEGMVPFKLFWRFADTGGSSFTAKRIIYGLFAGKALPDKMPEGIVFDGQEVVVTPAITSAFAPASPLELRMGKDMRDNVTKHGSKLFFFARFEYEDTLGALHARCFGREFILKGSSSDFAIPSGGPAYQCGK